MERGLERRDLRDVGPLPAEAAHRFDVRGIVRRRGVGELLHRANHIVVDDHRIADRPAVDGLEADRIGRAGQLARDLVDRIRVRAVRRAGLADFLERAARDLRAAATHVQQLVLEAGASEVGDQDQHVGFAPQAHG
jgi:hypothetical protein